MLTARIADLITGPSEVSAVGVMALADFGGENSYPTPAEIRNTGVGQQGVSA